MTSAIAGYFNFPGFEMPYNFILYPKTINENSCKYKIYNTVEKKIRDCKIYLPCSHYKGNGFQFKRLIGPTKEDKISVSLFDDYKQIKTTFNGLVQVKIYFTKQCIMQLRQKTHLTLVIFFFDFYEVQKR